MTRRTRSTRIYNRVMTLNSNGFAGMLPIAQGRGDRPARGRQGRVAIYAGSAANIKMKLCRLPSSASIPT